MKIYCIGCEKEVKARLSDGAERYPHRPDLAQLPFWHCDTCGAWVGCHHKTDNPTRPLGALATPEMVKARKEIHALIDPIWRSGDASRKELYKAISERVGFKYHTGELRSMSDARLVWRIAFDINLTWQYKTGRKIA